jgi:hypothetical protein
MNIELLTRVVQWAVDEENPATGTATSPRWDQGVWGASRALSSHVVEPAENNVDLCAQSYVAVKCDSGCCLAGNTTLINGDTFIIEANEVPTDPNNDDYAVEVSRVLTRDTKAVRRISERATELLGLTDAEADVLFSGGNEIREVVGYADAIAERHGHESLDLRGADWIRESEGYTVAYQTMLDWK